MLRLEIQPNPWSCLATSMAMVLNISTSEFERLAGHDGSEFTFPWLPEPQRRHGFHIQEAIHVAHQLQRSMTPFELMPSLAPTSPPPAGLARNSVLVSYGHKSLGDNWNLFTDLITSSEGIIECQTGGSGRSMHAVAYHHGYIFNPTGEVFAYSRSNCEARSLFTLRLWRIAKCLN